MKATQDPRPAIMIVATSGRGLAQAARRAGYRPLVADLYGDLDTQAAAEASEVVPGNLGFGFDPVALLPTLDRLAAGRQVLGVVTGNGFEDRTALLAKIAGRHSLIGNPHGVVAAIKDPVAFAALCARAEVPHPPTSPDLPPQGAWLRKRVGGSGGVHIVASPQRPHAGAGSYYQQRIAGEPISAAFLVAGGASRIVGLTRQWADHGSRQPFRYGGAVHPARIPPARTADIRDAIARLVPLTGLRGLNGADFLVRADGIDLLEINPRPGATLDVFADPEGTLFRLHVEACAGTLPDVVPEWPPAAAAIAYASGDLVVPAAFAWPGWTADHRPPGAKIPRGAPLCTVLAGADNAADAERLVRERVQRIQSLLRGGRG